MGRGDRPAHRGLKQSIEMRVPIFRLLILALWIAWLAYWLIAARGAKPTQWREARAEQWSHGLPAVLALILLVAPRLLPLPVAHFLPLDPAFPLVGTILTAAGIGIAVAARRQLAGNWSAAVEIKEGHALIRSGLYRHVQHPIYSGILLAVPGTAIVLGLWQSLLGFALLLLAFVLKSRHEEARLRAAFPDYDRYAQETAALIPFLL